MGDAFGDRTERPEAVEAAGADDDQIGLFRCVNECVGGVCVRPADLGDDWDECVEVERLALVRGDCVELRMLRLCEPTRDRQCFDRLARAVDAYDDRAVGVVTGAGDQYGARCSVQGLRGDAAEEDAGGPSVLVVADGDQVGVAFDGDFEQPVRRGAVDEPGLCPWQVGKQPLSLLQCSLRRVLDLVCDARCVEAGLIGKPSLADHEGDQPASRC